MNYEGFKPHSIIPAKYKAFSVSKRSPDVSKIHGVTGTSSTNIVEVLIVNVMELMFVQCVTMFPRRMLSCIQIPFLGKHNRL